MIANEVNTDHPAILRRPACEVDDNTDLGRCAVTVDVGPLPRDAVEAALASGARRAEALVARGLAWGTVIVLQSHVRVVGGVAAAARLRRMPDTGARSRYSAALGRHRHEEEGT
jgi:hypothetical protein